ncbi:MAG: AbrB/MazE/SpoVT family DNA-binding domain-containing protein [Nanoarchaeota archaeon]|nr:AbrB/MazE/SpoVT family DNA-binding domain-containing protein [Nanoarchaeota archaeon]MBU1270202.1 AbrB/MazE/SpoVT family DNA-binding domain-containing protein [Nanoarchaeota archaeon]MBU1604618.1 AbrB/MazE/SpoVT family DNA-binding domain-containing protein [Nanoarchaeota archaeon]MBU2443548.1 AbrB/MazE/SpoVT family DNA-binding domain-containing protein [Nanoarchaeota archaeon]
MTLKCAFCGSRTIPKNGMKFNSYDIDGWKCTKCKEEYYDPIQAQRILLINKLRDKSYKLSVNKVKSNLVLRIPKDVSDAMGLNDKSTVDFKLKNNKEIIITI